MQRTRDQIYDEWLVLQSREGDRQAFAELVSRFQGRLFGHAMQLTGRRDVALDAVQETWLALIRELHRLEDPARFAGFAHRILARRCADLARRQRRRREVGAELADATQSAAGSSERSERIDPSELGRVRIALDELPTDRRTLLAMHYLHEMPLADMANVLRVPIGTVKSRLHAARAELRRILERRSQPCPTSRT